MSRLGELLIREKLVSAQQVAVAQQEALRTGSKVAHALIKTGAVTEIALVKFLSSHFHVPSVDLSSADIDADVLKLVGQDVAIKHQVVPVKRQGSSLTVAMADPSNIFAIDDLKFLTGLSINVVVASEAAIADAIDLHYRGKNEPNFDEVMSGFDEKDIAFDAGEQAANAVEMEKSAEEAPVVKLVNLILVDAIKRGASDIHIEPYEKSFRVRYRVDGQLVEAMKPPLKLKGAVASRIKIMSSLDIAERRLPQDGRIKLKLGHGKEMDFRVSVLPTLFGEKIVMRLLDKGNLQLDMTKLGFEQQSLDKFKHGIHQPFGIVLVTGPTGSGKTTTLYSALSELNQTSDNISTAEDPVEFNLAGINQVQMHDDIGLNFAAALRSFLRQDPDIIMVGEIRDFETCEIAIKAALTGHLVLSTLHTNDAPATVSRMLNMGIEPFLITAALNVIVAQRLVRKVCNDCKEPLVVDAQILRDLQVKEADIPKANLKRGKGCTTCNNSGHKGRIAIYEVLVANEPIKDAILRGVSSTELKQIAIKNNFKTLRQAAISKLLDGQTTVEEVGRVTAAD